MGSKPTVPYLPKMKTKGKGAEKTAFGSFANEPVVMCNCRYQNAAVRSREGRSLVGWRRSA